MDFYNMMMLSSLINTLKTNNVYYNYFITLIIILYQLYTKYNNNIDFLNIYYFFIKSKVNKLIYAAVDNKSSERLKALMYYISTYSSVKHDIKTFKENEIVQWNKVAQEYKALSSIYKVSQKEIFNVTDDIKGVVRMKAVEHMDQLTRISTLKEEFVLEIFSEKLSIHDLINFVEECYKIHQKVLKEIVCKQQLFVDISWKDKELAVSFCPWESSVKFENLFFENKKEVINKINFFLNNKEWYQKIGKPHTLGILLWGPPGTGKTGFIKSIANLTQKHIINIKLSKNFDFTNLNNIFFNETINGELIIPLNKRIIVFEDIDCMTDIVKDRDLNEQKEKPHNEDVNVNILESLNKIIKTEKISECNNDNENNLSYLLNMLDGLKESSERIIIITTNKPEILDKALVRSGRIDIKLNMNYATKEDIVNILKNYWEEKEFSIPSLWNKVLPHADIVNCCYNSKNVKDTINHIEKLIKNKL